MSLAVIYSRAGLGINAPLVTVEVHLANGLPALSIVGLPETIGWDFLRLRRGRKQLGGPCPIYQSSSATHLIFSATLLRSSSPTWRER